MCVARDGDAIIEPRRAGPQVVAGARPARGSPPEAAEAAAAPASTAAAESAAPSAVPAAAAALAIPVPATPAAVRAPIEAAAPVAGPPRRASRALIAGLPGLLLRLEVLAARRLDIV